MFGSVEGLAFGREVSQVGFLVVEAGLGTMFPEEGRHLSVCCKCSMWQMLPGRGALTSPCRITATLQRRATG